MEKEPESQTRHSTDPDLELGFGMPSCLMGTAADPIISGIDEDAAVYIIGRIGSAPDYISINFGTSEIICATGTFDFGRYRINQNHNIYFYVPGNWHFMAITEYQPLQYPLESPVFTVEVQFPVVFEIMKAVKSDLDRLWSETLAAASEESRQEKGFWVYAKLDNGNLSYSVGNTETGKEITDCSTSASISPEEPDEVIPEEPWDSTMKFAVAYAHAHTTLYYCPSTLERKTGPSEGDDDYARKIQLPILVYDYSKSPIYGQDGQGPGLYDPAEVKHAGGITERSPYKNWASLQESPLNPK